MNDEYEHTRTIKTIEYRPLFQIKCHETLPNDMKKRLMKAIRDSVEKHLPEYDWIVTDGEIEIIQLY